MKDHLTDSEITQLLKRATRIVADAAVPTDLRPVAYAKTIDIALRVADGEQPQRGETPDTSIRASSLSLHAVTAKTYSVERAAQVLGLKDSDLPGIVECHGDSVTVVVQPSKLDKSARAAMRQLILLTTAVRQAGGLDPAGTLVAEVHIVLKQYPTAHDPKHVSDAIMDLADSLRRVGVGKKSALKMLPGGFRTAAALIGTLNGQSKADGQVPQAHERP